MIQNIYLYLFRDVALYLTAITVAAIFWHRLTTNENQELIHRETS